MSLFFAIIQLLDNHLKIHAFLEGSRLIAGLDCSSQPLSKKGKHSLHGWLTRSHQPSGTFSARQPLTDRELAVNQIRRSWILPCLMVTVPAVHFSQPDWMPQVDGVTLSVGDPGGYDAVLTWNPHADFVDQAVGQVPCHFGLACTKIETCICRCGSKEGDCCWEPMGLYTPNGLVSGN